MSTHSVLTDIKVDILALQITLAKVTASELKSLHKNPGIYSAAFLARQISMMPEHQSEFAQPAPATLLSFPLPTHSSPPSDENKMLEFIPEANDQIACLALGEPYPNHNYLPSVFQLLPSKNYKPKMQARSLNFLQQPKAPVFYILTKQLQNSLHHLSSDLVAQLCHVFLLSTSQQQHQEKQG